MITIYREAETHLGMRPDLIMKTEDKLKMVQTVRLAEQLCKGQCAPFRMDARTRQRKPGLLLHTVSLH